MFPHFISRLSGSQLQAGEVSPEERTTRILKQGSPLGIGAYITSITSAQVLKKEGVFQSLISQSSYFCRAVTSLYIRVKSVLYNVWITLYKPFEGIIMKFRFYRISSPEEKLSYLFDQVAVSGNQKIFTELFKIQDEKILSRLKDHILNPSYSSFQGKILSEHQRECLSIEKLSNYLFKALSCPETIDDQFLRGIAREFLFSFPDFAIKYIRTVFKSNSAALFEYIHALNILAKLKRQSEIKITSEEEKEYYEQLSLLSLEMFVSHRWKKDCLKKIVAEQAEKESREGIVEISQLLGSYSEMSASAERVAFTLPFDICTTDDVSFLDEIVKVPKKWKLFQDRLFNLSRSSSKEKYVANLREEIQLQRQQKPEFVITEQALRKSLIHTLVVSTDHQERKKALDYLFLTENRTIGVSIFQSWIKEMQTGWYHVGSVQYPNDSESYFDFHKSCIKQGCEHLFFQKIHELEQSQDEDYKKALLGIYQDM